MIETIFLSIPPLVFLGYLANMFIFRGPICKSKNKLNSKVAIVTGANCGIGYETALELARRGATVVLACRDLNKANEAVYKIRLETNNQNVEAEKLDLASLESIREFIERFKTKYSRLDILINNAGLLTSVYAETKDGFETQFGVMHLGHFYLTYLLLDVLKSSQHSRIINVSSEGHRFCNINWDDIMYKKKYNSFSVYQQAKLANILFTHELAKRYKDDGITSVSVHPGFVKTEINRHFSESYFKRILYVFFYPIYILGSMDSKLGAQTSVHCAVADEIIEQNGCYFSKCKPSKCSAQGRDDQESKKLWDFSLKLLKLE